MRKHSVSGYDRHNLSVARSADLNGRYSKSPLAKGYVPEADEEIRVLKPIMKKMYGQYLLDQVTDICLSYLFLTIYLFYRFNQIKEKNMKREERK